MLRTALSAATGVLVGVGLAVLTLCVTSGVLARMTAPKTFEVEHWVVYLSVVLGAGFGGLCGALAGVVGAVGREWRRGAGERTGS
jgi:hypothetical protein